MNKILCIQISNTLINKDVNKNNIMNQYYENIYKYKKDQGYYKNKHFWELPLWICEIDYNIKTAIHICTDIQKTIEFIKNSNYKYICFSVMDVNKNIIRDIMFFYNALYPTNKICFILGGYIDFSFFYELILPKFKICNNIPEFITFLSLQYKKGLSFRLFKDFKTIPRLTLSTGCLYNCDFCTIEHKIKEYDQASILNQIDSFKPLKFKLVYINDKTFSQASNYKYLVHIYNHIKSYNPKFEGFIIQTTTFDLVKKLTPEFIKKSHIKFIELGIETFNDHILKKYNKANNEKYTLLACNKIRNLDHVKLIPNILIGIPEETYRTYKKTIKFLIDNSDIISHLNIYNLAVYENTNLAKKLKHNNTSDNNELSLKKSFHKDINIHKKFYNQVFNFGNNILKRE